ncbi:hypothetical protein ACFY93_23705 [Streptomyces sp. NPDC008313]|uniref:hypothetical protein n=1 Tax=Streptomyces sp. NPDC008313 TaxID=3364826 RepID=UPI0036EFA406
MSAETLLAAGYVSVLLVVVVGLEVYGRQSTSAWGSRIFAGYRRAVDDAPTPATDADWPHSEVGRFHRALSMFVSLVAVVLAGAEAIRHHQPAEAVLLAAVAVPHCLLAARLGRRLRHSEVLPPG